MKTKAAVLGYPNSNNLGDFIQSIAASQWIGSKEMLSIDRDQLHRYNERHSLLGASVVIP